LQSMHAPCARRVRAADPSGGGRMRRANCFADQNAALRMAARARDVATVFSDCHSICLFLVVCSDLVNRHLADLVTLPSSSQLTSAALCDSCAEALALSSAPLTQVPKRRNHEESTSSFSHSARTHGLRPLRKCVRLEWLRVLRLRRLLRLRLCWLRLSPYLRRLRLGLWSILARRLGLPWLGLPWLGLPWPLGPPLVASLERLPQLWRASAGRRRKSAKPIRREKLAKRRAKWGAVPTPTAPAAYVPAVLVKYCLEQLTQTAPRLAH